MEILSLHTKKRVEFVEITAEIERIISQKKIQQGIGIIFCPHTTAGLTINENADPSVTRDIIYHLQELIPEDKNYAHLEGNADAHIKSSLVGNSLFIIIEEARLILGRWQGIYFCEFDGPRKRQVYIKIIEDRR